MTGHVRKRGDKWYFSFEASSVDGKRKRIERVGGRTKKEAETALRKALEQYNNAGMHFEPSKISVSDYLDYFISNYIELHLRENSQRARKQIIKNHIRPAIGQYQLIKLSPQTLQPLITEKAIKYTRNYASMIYTTLSLALKWACEWEFIQTNPMNKVKMPKKTEEEAIKKIKILTADKIEECLKRLKETHHYVPFQIALHTGMRSGEIASLQWTDVDFIKRTISVDKRLDFRASVREWEFLPPKTESSIRKIAIGNDFIAILKEQKRVQKENKLKYGEYYTLNDFICTKENGELVTTKTISRMSKIIKRDLSIDFNFHMLRHTHASLLLESGAPHKIVQERLGHSSVAITMDIYSHTSSDFQKASVDNFESFLKEKRKFANDSM
ncbi:MAG: tyrosine-type recombinase/integrase [Alkaliphilus sp.]